MKNKPYRANYDFVELVETLYGSKDYKRVKNFINFQTQKKYYLKIWKTFELAFFASVGNIDNNHLRKITDIFENGEELLNSQKKKESLESTFILIQSKLILTLLGGFEDLYLTNSYTSRVNRKSDWNLREHRTISYLQSNDQKVSLIAHLSLKGKTQLTYEDFISKRIELKNNNIAFLDFFRNKYPEDYSSIF